MPKQKSDCERYYEHRKKYGDGDWSILAQTLRIQCQIQETDFDSRDSIDRLKTIVRDASDKMGKYTEDLKPISLKSLSFLTPVALHKSPLDVGDSIGRLQKTV